MLRFESSSGTLFTFLFFFIFNSNPSSSPTSFTDLRRLISHIVSSFSILISDLHRNLSYNIIQFYSRNSSPNHRFRGDELLSCLKGTEAAGVVTAVGTGVCDLKIGDVVYHHFGSQVEQGHKVLVHAAAGGVGSVFCQVGKYAWCHCHWNCINQIEGFASK
ncbi:uncharacterized protein LOC118480508 [Helianthus annuus]|uniref:uncharacterized protein LOC118480508 n=1 Tax=Helianthus annuus TaxID=4232 RepID=UPI001653233C|nr:uncharacterized protein LOC118480508 [Helianthus annuus]